MIAGYRVRDKNVASFKIKLYKMLRPIVLILLLGTASLQLSAHALWIETSPEGKSGSEHTVKVFYGEPSAGVPDKIEAWWSDVASFTLWLVKPDGSKQQLEVSAQGDHFAAIFTPSAEGLYTLSISHNVAEIDGGTQYQFNATAMVRIGDATTSSDYAAGVSELYLYVDPAAKLRTGKDLAVSAHSQEGAAGEAYITAFAPSGWSRSFQADASGKGSFVPEWAGTYLLEAGKGEEVTGKPYKNIYRVATLQIAVAR